MERRQNPQVLIETLALKGKDVVDVGCGVGFLTRLMTQSGARVVGLECHQGQLAKAREAEPAGHETYVEGIAEELPLADGSMDIVVFANSLHHVPIGGQAKALQEAARVLRPGGQVYISEPLAEGAFFELIRPVHDETRVRAHAHQAIQGAGAFGFTQVSESVHCHTMRFADYEQLKARIMAINPETAAKFAEHDDRMRTAFRHLGRAEDGQFLFDQPTRIDLLRRN